MGPYKRGILIELRLCCDLHRPALAGVHELVKLMQEDESFIVIDVLGIRRGGMQSVYNGYCNYCNPSAGRRIHRQRTS